MTGAFLGVPNNLGSDTTKSTLLTSCLHTDVDEDNIVNNNNNTKDNNYTIYSQQTTTTKSTLLTPCLHMDEDEIN